MTSPIEKARRSQCSGCPAEVVWVQNEKSGKATPLDPEPKANGNIVLNGRITPKGVLVVHYLTKVEKAEPAHPSRPRYTSHFATCPKARQFRRD